MQSAVLEAKECTHPAAFVKLTPHTGLRTGVHTLDGSAPQEQQ